MIGMNRKSHTAKHRPLSRA